MTLENRYNDTNLARPAKKQLSIFTKFYRAKVLPLKSVAFLRTLNVNLQSINLK
jgi:hypothetical protein